MPDRASPSPDGQRGGKLAPDMQSRNEFYSFYALAPSAPRTKKFAFFEHISQYIQRANGNNDTIP